MKRGFLLPDGCKDLIDVLKLKEHQEFGFGPLQALPAQFNLPELPPQPPTLPPVNGELIIKSPTTVQDLAAQLGQKPFKIIAELMGIGIFASVSQVLSFKAISIIARQYGFIAKRAA